MYPILFTRRQHVAVRDVYCGSDAAPGSQYCSNLPLLLLGNNAGLPDDAGAVLEPGDAVDVPKIIRKKTARGSARCSRRQRCGPGCQYCNNLPLLLQGGDNAGLLDDAAAMLERGYDDRRRDGDVHCGDRHAADADCRARRREPHPVLRPQTTRPSRRALAVCAVDYVTFCGEKNIGQKHVISKQVEFNRQGRI